MDFLYAKMSLLSLFNENGLMRKTPKSDLIHETEKVLAKKYPRQPNFEDNVKLGIVTDIMVVIRKIQKIKKKFGDVQISQSICRKIWF